jgi:predicted esterase
MPMRTSQDSSLATDLRVTAEIKLYYDLYVPESAKNAPLLITVHGYGAHKRYMMREARAVVPDGWVIASLQAPHPHYRQTKDGYRVGFGWLTDHNPQEDIALHHKFVFDVIEKLSVNGSIDQDSVYMYGFSQACALNFRFALTFPDVLRGIVGVCGGIPGDVETNGAYRRFEGETFYLYGDDDEFYTQEQFGIFNKKLGSILPNYRSKHYTAKHEITDEMREDIRSFLREFD